MNTKGTLTILYEIMRGQTQKGRPFQLGLKYKL